MTDAAYCYQEDVRTRSDIKKSAIHKKNGSKSKKCTLPSDYMTEGQKKKMNGRIYSMKMNEPITDWKYFRSFPENLQVEYLNNLIQNYGARGCDLAQMLGTSAPALYAVCKSYSNPVIFPRGGFRNMNEKFMDFLTTPAKPEEVTKEVIAEPVPEEPETLVLDISKREIPQTVKIEKAYNYGMVDVIRVHGHGNKTDILKLIETMLGDDIDYDFSVDFTVTEAKPEKTIKPTIYTNE